MCDILGSYCSLVMFLIMMSPPQANVTPDQIDCLCYTRGPGMGGPLQSVAVVVRVLAQVRLSIPYEVTRIRYGHVGPVEFLGSGTVYG